MVLSSAPFVAAMFSQCVLLLSLNWDTNMWTQRRAARMLRLVTLQTCGSVHCTKALDVPTEKVSCSPLLATSFGSIHIYVLWDITSPTWQLEKTAGGLYKLHDVNLKTFLFWLCQCLICQFIVQKCSLKSLLYGCYAHVLWPLRTCAEFTADIWTQEENREGPRLHLVWTWRIAVFATLWTYHGVSNLSVCKRGLISASFVDTTIPQCVLFQSLTWCRIHSRQLPSIMLPKEDPKG